MSGWVDAGYPWATITINGAGSIALGLLVGGFSHSIRFAKGRAFAAAGFCAGYTTFSAYSAEIVSLATTGRMALAAVYAVASLVVSIAGAAAGYGVGRAIAAPRKR
jgi:CrcB protein